MSQAFKLRQAFKLNGMQIENIIDKLVPLIAAPEDHDFFRAILQIKAEESSSGHFAFFVSQLLNAQPIEEIKG
jgi:hypothetical protein